MRNQKFCFTFALTIQKMADIKPLPTKDEPKQTFQKFADENDYLAWLNQEPRIKKENTDGSEYVPISCVQEDLFFGFCGNTKFELLRENLHNKGLVAVGRLYYQHPISKEWLHQDGSAALPYMGGLHLDFPNVHARVLLSCAKKISRRFGQALNRDLEDAPIDIIEEIDGETPEVKRMRLLIEGSKTMEELAGYKKQVPKQLLPHYMMKLKSFT